MCALAGSFNWFCKLAKYVIVCGLELVGCAETQDLPHRLWLFNGGFSCKSFSRLNTDNKALKHAMAEGNEAGAHDVKHLSILDSRYTFLAFS